MRRSRTLFALGATALLAVAGCQGDGAARPAAAKVSIDMSATSPDRIETVLLSVSDAGAAGSPVVQAQLSRAAGNTWSAYVTQVPAPRRCTFVLEAFDAGGSRVYAGETTADVVAGETTQLAILAQPPAPEPITTTTPTISAVSISSDPVAPGEQVVLNAASAGTNPVFDWSDGCGGTFLDASAASTVWTAPTPAPATPCLVAIHVSAGTSSATTYFTIDVR
jgi:hypothetical protein